MGLQFRKQKIIDSLTEQCRTQAVKDLCYFSPFVLIFGISLVSFFETLASFCGKLIGQGRKKGGKLEPSVLGLLRPPSQQFVMERLKHIPISCYPPCSFLFLLWALWTDLYMMLRNFAMIGPHLYEAFVRRWWVSFDRTVGFVPGKGPAAIRFSGKAKRSLCVQHQPESSVEPTLSRCCC